MSNSDKAIFVQEFLLFLSAVENIESQLIDVSVGIDLEDLGFTDAEIQKLGRLTRRLELALLTEFTRYLSAASVVVEIRKRSN